MTAQEAWSAEDLHALGDLLAHLSPGDSEVERLDQVAALERLKAAAAAAQVVLTDTFAADALATGSPEGDTPGRHTPPRAMSLGAEVALATLSSPWQGDQRMRLSSRLRHDLPATLDLLRTGVLTEHRAFAIAREVEHLTPAQRRLVDAHLATRAPGLGDVELRRCVRRLCLTHAADAEAKRHRRARADRRVTSRTLDDGTGQMIAVIPQEHLSLVMKALDHAATTGRAAGDERTPGQVRADTLVARLTGHDPTTPLPVRVELVIGVETLFGDATEPGQVRGAGFLPAALCTDLVRQATSAARATLRRLFASPQQRTLVAAESTARTFPAPLGDLLGLRDGDVCRTPWCNAPIRHRDHVRSAATGGATSLHNGQGLCERCNYTKESPGWASWVATEPAGEGHEVHGVTEHLRLWHSTAPPLPGGPGRPPSPHRIDLVFTDLVLAS